MTEDGASYGFQPHGPISSPRRGFAGAFFKKSVRQTLCLKLENDNIAMEDFIKTLKEQNKFLNLKLNQTS